MNTRLNLRNWARTHNASLGIERRNTCHTTAAEVQTLLLAEGYKSTLVYAEQDNGYPHWFNHVEVINQSGIVQTLILDFTACQFCEDIYPMICLGTFEELHERFKNVLTFWVMLGTWEDTQNEEWLLNNGFERT